MEFMVEICSSIDKYFYNIYDFVCGDKENESDDKTGSEVEKWFKKLTEIEKEKIKIYANYVSKNCSPIDLIVNLQTRNKPIVHTVYEKLDKVQRRMISLNEGKDIELSSHFNEKKKREFTEKLKIATARCLFELQKFEIKDPAKDLFTGLDSAQSKKFSQIPTEF